MYTEHYMFGFLASTNWTEIILPLVILLGIDIWTSKIVQLIGQFIKPSVNLVKWEKREIIIKILELFWVWFYKLSHFKCLNINTPNIIILSVQIYLKKKTRISPWHLWEGTNRNNFSMILIIYNFNWYACCKVILYIICRLVI